MCILFDGLVFGAEMDSVVRVIRSEKYSTQTTRSWEFSGVEEDKPRLNDLVSRAKFGKDVVIGMLDSGKKINKNFQLFCCLLLLHCFPCDSLFAESF